MKILIIFILANTLNVIIQTVKSLCTIKCGKFVAALINALAYGFYTYILILMSAELPLLAKCFIVGGCNFVGVYAVKYFEEKMRKDKLWKIEVTIPKAEQEKMLAECVIRQLSYNYIDIQKYVLFNFYCPTQKDSLKVKELLKGFNAKYFVNESKILY